MCTLVLLRRPAHSWPLILAANRDEMAGRPWDPPARHWPDRPEVVAGRDRLAGGSWLGLNDLGVVAGVLNRRGSLGPAPDARSRGELVLEALDHADAAAAADALAALDPRAYRSFNLVVADDRDAFWIRGLGREGPARVAVAPVPASVSMLTAYDLDDPGDGRIATFLPRFRAAAPPDPDAGDWAAWETLLATRPPEGAPARESAMSFALDSGFGTRSSSLIALPSRALEPERRPLWRFAAGAPDHTPFMPVTL